MKTSYCRRSLALLLSALFFLALIPSGGRAAPTGVYLTAADEQLLDLNSESMPFWSQGVLYISSRVFEGTDLDVAYVRNTSMGMAVLYNPKTDLRFDLNNHTVATKQGFSYNARAIEKGGVVFFPLDMVCRHFGLSWSLTNTETVPLIRVRSSKSRLSDADFVAAAASQMRERCAAYERWLQSQADPPETWPPVQATGGQKVHLIIQCQAPEDTRSLLPLFGSLQATFLLTAEQMADGDLIRGLVSGGHAIALLVTAEAPEQAEEELRRARDLVWQAACSWLGLVWYEGAADIAPLLEETGCSLVTAEVDRRETDLSSTARIRSLLTAIGRYREDLSVLLGADSGCAEGLAALLEELEQAQYQVCAWRV